MSLQDGQATLQVHRCRLNGAISFDRTFRLCEVGDHIEHGGKWAVVRRVSGSRMNIEFLGQREDPGRQEFPEYEAMQRFAALAKAKVEAGWAVKDTRNGVRGTE